MARRAVDVNVRSSAEALFRNDAPRLWRAVLLSTGDPDVASDAVAEAFALAIRRWGELRDPPAWIWRVAFRLAARDTRTGREAEELPGELAQDMPEPLVDLARALRELTPHQRAAVVLHDYAGYSYKEIARLLDSTVSAVGVHIHRGRRRLRTMLGGNDD
jgi:RNA polymerase sigma-70 factor (ECF subfamily)